MTVSHFLLLALVFVYLYLLFGFSFCSVLPPQICASQPLFVSLFVLWVAFYHSFCAFFSFLPTHPSIIIWCTSMCIWFHANVSLIVHIIIVLLLLPPPFFLHPSFLFSSPLTPPPLPFSSSFRSVPGRACGFDLWIFGSNDALGQISWICSFERKIHEKSHQWRLRLNPTSQSTLSRR